MTRASLAVNDRTGQVHYLDVVVFGEGAKVLGQYGDKGRGLIAYGRMSTHSWVELLQADEGVELKLGSEGVVQAVELVSLDLRWLHERSELLVGEER